MRYVESKSKKQVQKRKERKRRPVDMPEEDRAAQRPRVSSPTLDYFPNDCALGRFFLLRR